MKKTVYLNKKLAKNSAITLIALVITLIVLLILAGVAVASLTGENGILTKASTVKAETEKTTAEEEVKLEVIESYDDNGKFDYETFKTNVENNLGATVKDNEDGTCTVTHKGYDVTVNKTTGKVISTVQTGETLPPPEEQYNTGTTVAEAKIQNLPFKNNTTIVDDFNNPVKIPAGFKIGAKSATAVTGGIVIEDAKYAGTIGSEFVWIPVGNVKTSASDTTGTNITLGRYYFTDSGETESVPSNYTEDTQENHDSSYGNAIATNIGDFTTKATASRGYYIGRYEARVDGATFNDMDVGINESGHPYYTGSDTMWTGYTNGQLVCKPGSQVWNLVTQNKASDLSKNMYTGKTFTSDLMNSYAWDTATLFLQTFDDRTLEGKTEYSKLVSLNTELANEGTNSLTDSSKQDKICNVWDMASNCYEWTTETNSDSTYHCVRRGGDYDVSYRCTSLRGSNSATHAYSSNSFRPLLYL